MNNRGRSMIRPMVIFTAVAISLVIGAGAQSLDRLSGNPPVTRADIVILDTMKEFGALERPAVLFLHDKHTEVLAKKKKDCKTCHLDENDQLSPKFKRLKNTDRQIVMDTYHTQCIACHKDETDPDGKRGPVECGECHRKHPQFVSGRLPLGMDKSLHYRHIQSNAKKCELCHHEYDSKAKKLFYAKEKESTCRYCHLKETQENRISMKLASHLACIDCHRKRQAKDLDAGPVKCSGCHDPLEQKMIETAQDVPRMERKQPDIVFVRQESPLVKQPQIDRGMNPVPFNHKGHEGYNDTCRVCHHASLNSCSKCHTPAGSDEGKQINLTRAMHQERTSQSCMGCHQIKQQDKSCAGCHASEPTSDKQDNSSCRSCHSSPLPEGTLLTEATSLAAKWLKDREQAPGTLADGDIPESVVIKGISQQYEPVKLPHRKMIRTLIKNIQNNRLAQYFHREETTLCQGCHHNSPASAKPPGCSSCHGQPFDEKNIFKPGLKAAYHQQCMECHAVMGIEKPAANDCIACHIEKKKW